MLLTAQRPSALDLLAVECLWRWCLLRPRICRANISKPQNPFRGLGAQRPGRSRASARVSEFRNAGRWLISTKGGPRDFKVIFQPANLQYRGGWSARPANNQFRVMAREAGARAARTLPARMRWPLSVSRFSFAAALGGHVRSYTSPPGPAARRRNSPSVVKPLQRFWFPVFPYSRLWVPGAATTLARSASTSPAITFHQGLICRAVTAPQARRGSPVGSRAQARRTQDHRRKSARWSEEL